ncbi:hypothetical protein C0J52_01057 [Blattella germanica]|nr:hypothetical protein C0J52_01057 [Blattella germanica]
MDTLGVYVSSLLKMLTTNDNRHIATEVCQHLQAMLHSALPGDLVEEAIIRVLRKFEDTYKLLIDDCYEQKIPFSDIEFIDEIATDMFVAIVHPSTTRVECYAQRSHPDVLDGYRMRYSDLIYNALPKLKNLKALCFGESYYIGDRHELNHEHITENLEEFRSELSSNQEIQTLAQCSKKLKILDFGDSLDVCEESIPYILDLECLEELDVHCSSIDNHGFKELLIELTRTIRPCGRYASELLQRFSCGALYADEIDVIANNYKNLRSLIIKHALHDLTPLRTLKYLYHLEIQTKYHLLQGLLSSIGNQLVCLELRNVFDVNLDHVAICCPSLRCLHLVNSPLVEDIDFTKMNEHSKFHKAFAVPQFPQVTCLELDFAGDNGTFALYVSSCFKNVRKLLLSKHKNSMLLDKIVDREIMEHVEVVVFRNPDLVVLQFFEKYVVITHTSFNRIRYTIKTSSVVL